MKHTCQFSSVFNHLTPTYSTQDSETGRYRMLAALEINLALWGMIGCAVMEAAQFFAVL
jgi:hypothetical protein